MNAHDASPREGLNLQPQVHHTLEVLDDLASTQLALAVQAVHKGNGALSDLVVHGLGTNHHFHLETVALALRVENNLLQDLLLVQPEATSQVANTRHQHHVGDQVGSARGKLPEQVPAIDTALNISAARISGAGDNVRVSFALDLDHLGDELRVVTEIGIHDDDEVAAGELQSVDVGGSQTKFALAGLQDNVFLAIELLELLRDLEGAVRGAVVDDDDLPVQLAIFIKWSITKKKI